MTQNSSRDGVWPPLPLESWEDTRATLHMWIQIVGKIRLVQSPWVNHSWHVPLYVTAAGLTTSAISYGERLFNIDFDFTRHLLTIRSSDGDAAGFELGDQSVAAFYRKLMRTLDEMGLHVDICRKPNEVAPAVRFEMDETHKTYDPDAVNRFWRILFQADRLMKQFRAGFIGKCSPVHLFWGGLDLAVTRFSGRTAPQHPGGIPNLPDFVTREAYSHEVSSCGFWPGNEGGPVAYPAFYSYAYPTPAGFAEAAVKPAAAFYSKELGEFILPYDAVRQAESPDRMLLEFFQSTYEAAANLAGWDRPALERTAGESARKNQP